MEPKLSSHNIVTIPHNDELIRIRMSKIAFFFFFFFFYFEDTLLVYTSTDCNFKNTLRKIRLNINYRNNKCMFGISDVK
jgi:hypothetical protein